MPKSKEFISSSDSGSDVEEPKPKKKKTVEKKEEKKEEKAVGSNEGPTRGKGGEYMFQLSRMRFATVSEFRGKVMVGIREYYEADGELRPGKKGISLTMEQWHNLKELIPQIDKTVKEM